MKTDERFAYLNACPDLQKAQANRIKLGSGQMSTLQKIFPKRVHQDIGCGMKKQPELIRFFSCVAGPVGFQGDFVVFDEKFRLAPSAIDHFVKILCPLFF